MVQPELPPILISSKRAGHSMQTAAVICRKNRGHRIFGKGHSMTWLRLFFMLLGGLGATSSQALTPLPDGSPAFFAGDWIGTGANDQFCFIRLRPDGVGTVLVSGASGDWLGASIRWRNQRQSIVLVDVSALPAEPRRRLMPLSRLALRSGINRTIHLKLNEDIPGCELQLRADVLRRAGQADMLLDNPAGAGKPDGGK
jgi:hypothetical protein